MKKHILATGAVAATIIALSAVPAFAALVPTLTVSPIVGGSTVQATVFGADPNASVLLYYPSTSALASANIGTTNSIGYLNTTINSATYNIASGASVYVVVNGQASQAAIWPSSTNSGTLTLSQTTLNLSVGQSQTISAAVSAALSMDSNSNSSVAGAAIAGNQITVTGFNPGVSNISICANGIGCSTIYVTVQSTLSTGTTALSLSPSTLSLSAGQSQAVSIVGSGTYALSSNTNPAVASANVSGSILNIGAITAGTDIVSVCATTANGTSCAQVNINVTAAPASTATTVSALSFSPSSINLATGQNQTVAILGGTPPYYVSTNSGPGSVTANVSGNNVNLTGIAFGGANITICAAGGQCGNLYAYVAPSGASSLAPTANPTAATQPVGVPTVSSFTISSTNAGNGLLSARGIVTFTFTLNQAVSTPVVSIAGQRVAVSGTGSGPYTASYTLVGNEPQPVSLAATFTNLNGNAGQLALAFGNSSMGATSASANTANTAAVANTSPGASSTGNLSFTTLLSVGSTGAEVTALQNRLTALGLYSGPITGKFGYLTQVAVKKYQAKHGLSQLGIVGPATRTLLNQGI